MGSRSRSGRRACRSPGPAGAGLSRPPSPKYAEQLLTHTCLCAAETTPPHRSNPWEYKSSTPPFSKAGIGRKSGHANVIRPIQQAKLGKKCARTRADWLFRVVRHEKSRLSEQRDRVSLPRSNKHGREARKKREKGQAVGKISAPDPLYWLPQPQRAMPHAVLLTSCWDGDPNRTTVFLFGAFWNSRPMRAGFLSIERLRADSASTRGGGQAAFRPALLLPGAQITNQLQAHLSARLQQRIARMGGRLGRALEGVTGAFFCLAESGCGLGWPLSCSSSAIARVSRSRALA